MESLHHVPALVEHYIALYGIAALAVIIFFESLGLPLPGESALIAASLAAVHGDLSIWQVAIAGFSGAVAGDSTGYAIGRVGGRSLLRRFGPHLGLTATRLQNLEARFRRWGALLVMAARFIVVLRQLNGLVAGSMAMPWFRFVAANAVGAILWTALWTLGPYFFTEAFLKYR